MLFLFGLRLFTWQARAQHGNLATENARTEPIDISLNNKNAKMSREEIACGRNDHCQLFQKLLRGINKMAFTFVTGIYGNTCKYICIGRFCVLLLDYLCSAFHHKHSRNLRILEPNIAALTGFRSTVRKSSPPRMLLSNSLEPPGYSL